MGECALSVRQMFISYDDYIKEVTFPFVNDLEWMRHAYSGYETRFYWR